MCNHEKIIHELFKSKSYPNDAFELKKSLNGKDIIIYGAGECFHWFYEIAMVMYGVEPTAILDCKFIKCDNYKGIPAYDPNNYQPTKEVKENSIVIICVGNNKLHNEIVCFLRGMGFKNILRLIEIYEIHNPFNSTHELNRNGFKYYKDNKNKILDGFKLFTDDLSRDTYRRFLQTHMEKKPVPLQQQARNEQYFPKDIQLKQGYSRFINCGAYDGDTIRLLNQIVGKVDQIICFEPEPEVYKRLVEYLKENKNELAKDISTYPYAVFNEQKTVSFNSRHGLGSRIDKNGNCYVKSKSLDKFIPEIKPTFINMDIEGAELAALSGAESILRKCKPDLGICVYHSPEQLWEIPLYINSLDLGYKFFLRNYTSFTIETVMYGTV